jgi:cytoskeletal protein RodZ
VKQTNRRFVIQKTNQTLFVIDTKDPERHAANPVNKPYNQPPIKNSTSMKNFFSQTWVVALLVVVVLGVVCWIAFKKKKEETPATVTPETETPATTEE